LRQQKLKLSLIGTGVAVALWSFWVGKAPLAQGHCASMMSSTQESIGAQNNQFLLGNSS
jgi:hypothetical protein